MCVLWRNIGQHTQVIRGVSQTLGPITAILPASSLQPLHVTRSSAIAGLLKSTSHSSIYSDTPLNDNKNNTTQRTIKTRDGAQELHDCIIFFFCPRKRTLGRRSHVTSRNKSLLKPRPLFCIKPPDISILCLVSRL